MRILVTFYSRTGNTSLVAGKLAGLLNAESSRILSRTAYDGAFGALKAVYHSVSGKSGPLLPSGVMPNNYDLVVIGGPVWAGRIAPPVKRYIETFREQIKDVAFFVTLGGSGAEKALKQMEELSGKAPMATLAVTAKDLAAGRYDAQSRAFAARIEQEIKQKALKRA
jgi:flavodoxin